ncbi:nucleotidyltransferase substrate binding protein [Clostridium novyi]
MQCFEYTFELAWKTMKDYLELEGFEVESPML